jgi:hypothetical protein
MKKEAAPKCKGLKRKTSNEKKGTPKMQRARNRNELHEGDLKN